MASNSIKDRVLDALRRVTVPGTNKDVVTLGLVSEIVEQSGKVYFSLAATPERVKTLEPVRFAAETAAKSVPGVVSATVVLTADKAAATPETGGRGIAGVKHVIAVASGKGGVGKSTTAVNLALGFQANGLTVGVLDADIYGPSMPKLLRIKGKPQMASGKALLPMESYGLKVMSMGFLVDEETPMIWRGPMVISAITQMLKDVVWGDLDVMVVDMPPGTGDAQLTMAQQVPLSGAVIVSTPQDLALIDARKGLHMFKRVNVPVLGIVENMSYFLCPNCGSRSDIFGHGGARAEAERLGVPFLGEVPLHMDIREKSDAGLPPVVTDPGSPHAKLYCEIAAAAWRQVMGAARQKAAPRIVVE